MSTRIRTLNFLPDIFKTKVNDEVLSASLDQIVNQSNLARIEGYIGRTPSKLSNRKNVVEPTKIRTDYQLEPGVIFKVKDTSTANDFISYPEIINSIKLSGGITNRHDRLFNNEYYSWDSFINLDMFVNYSQYYWLPNGPETVEIISSSLLDVNSIIGQKQYTSENGVVFTNGLKIRFITPVYPNSYYEVDYYIEGVGESIQLLKADDFVAPELFTVEEYLPWSSLDWDEGRWDIKYYYPKYLDYITINRGSRDKNAWSRSNMWFHIDVIRATAKYINRPNYLNNANSANRAVRPIIEFYPDLRLFNSGINGKSPIDFIDFQTTDALSEVGGQFYYYPDVQAWTEFACNLSNVVTSGGFSTATITVPKSSVNGEFVINQYITDSYVVFPSSPPIPPYQPKLPTNTQIKSINDDGTNVVLTVSWPSAFDPTTGPDPIPSNFKVSANPFLDSDYNIMDGARIVFANDNDPNVRNKIYVARYSKITGSTLPSITLTVAPDGDLTEYDQIVATRGFKAKSLDYYYDGNTWVYSQQKTKVNQPPLFDIFDNNNISFGNDTYYPSTTFNGSTLFQYSIGSGTNDSVLGFPIKYTSGSSVGEIVFDVTLNSDIFTYSDNNTSIKQNVNTGYVHSYETLSNYTRLIGWQTAYSESVQYQIFEFEYIVDSSNNQYTADIPARYNTVLPLVKVFSNNVIQSYDSFTYTVNNDNTTTITFTKPIVNSNMRIEILSDVSSNIGYYQIPLNLSNNPFNTNSTVLSAGDIREHYNSIFYNSPGITGSVYGSNNYRDLGNLVPYGNKLIQNSSSLVLPAALQRHYTHDLVSSLLFNNTEYIKFKSLLVNTANTSDYGREFDPAYMLDDVLDQLNSNKSDNDSFFWSDMLPSNTPYHQNSYTFKNSLSTTIFPLSKIYETTKATYDGVLVYLTRNNKVTQLLRNIDYTINNTSPEIVVTKDLINNDIITVKEYNQTYGSYVPNTPSKLGLYPVTVPQIIYDETYVNPTYFIVGHDGSYTKLYGELDSDGNLIDFRDIVLFEYECRVYNNIKLPFKNNETCIDLNNIIPGFFRDTEYSYDEYIQIYSSGFLNWIGQNRIDYRSNYYSISNEFTWNYRDTNNKVNREPINIGNWRGIYQYYYDSVNPHSSPWELLHYNEKPSWWDNYYGVGPYTSDNKLLWTDLANGYDYNDNNPRIIESAIRPDLLKVIPVDTLGNLKSPFTSVVLGYQQNSFNSMWNVGDLGPAEFSYRRSSSWPFDLIRMVALMKPAKLYNLGVDVDNYYYSSEFNQYLVNNRNHLDITKIDVYGNGIPKTSYLNWIVDYEKRLGVDSTTNIKTMLTNLDVRLVYRLAGYSDDDLLKWYVEKGSPESARSSLLIPDNSIKILLHENQPFDRLIYSSVIIQSTTKGYKVYGNSQSVATFNILTPKINGNYSNIKIENLNVNIANDYYDTITVIPYGTEFNSIADVSQFLASYGKYLEKQGMQFETVENGLEVNWQQMVAEYLYWAQCGWVVGSIININPAANTFTFEKENVIVQPLTIKDKNYILNQDLYPIKISDLNIYRQDNTFVVKTYNVGDTISYSQFNLSNFEHGIVFDNITQFNDLIYNLVTGARQERLLVRGFKTSEWNGSYDASGFIINQDNIKEWNNSTKYTTGSIVKYKNKYYIATKVIQPSNTFDETIWKITDYNKIQKGLLPNTSTRSYESTLYYDLHTANLEKDTDLLAFSLIGFRPRDYLSSADLSDITQINLYHNFIRTKGTTLAANNFKNVNLLKGKIDYQIYENWSIKSSEYGGVLNNNFIEVQLNESLLTGNPSILGTDNRLNVQQFINIRGLYNYGKPIFDTSILPKYEFKLNSTQLQDSGYVNFNDVKTYSYFYSGLSDSVEPISNVYLGDYLWIANMFQKWNVLAPIRIEQTYTPCNSLEVNNVINVLDGTVNIVFNNPHYLNKFDTFAILNFGNNIDGYYIVNNVVDPYTVNVDLNVNTSVNNLTGIGTPVRLQSMRVDQPSNISDLELLDYEFMPTKVWVDTSKNNNWALYKKNFNYQYYNNLTKTDDISYGSTVHYSDVVGLLVSDIDKGIVYRYEINKDYGVYFGNYYAPVEEIVGTPGFGTSITSSDTIVCIATCGSEINVYELKKGLTFTKLSLVQTIVNPTPSVTWASTIDFSKDGQWLYVSDPDNNEVYVYHGNSDFSGSITNNLLTVYDVDLGKVIPNNIINNNPITITNIFTNYIPPFTVDPISFTVRTTGLPSGLTPGMRVQISGVIPTSFNGIFNIQSISGNDIIIATDIDRGNGTTFGVINPMVSINYKTNSYVESGIISAGYDFNILSITSDGSSFTVTTSDTPYIWVEGMEVTISGVLGPTSAGNSYNGTWLISSGTNNTFTVLSTMNLGTAILPPLPTYAIARALGTNGIGVYTLNNSVDFNGKFHSIWFEYSNTLNGVGFNEDPVLNITSIISTDTDFTVTTNGGIYYSGQKIKLANTKLYDSVWTISNGGINTFNVLTSLNLGNVGFGVNSYNITRIESTNNSFIIDTNGGTYNIGDIITISNTNSLYDGNWIVSAGGNNTFTVLNNINLGNVIINDNFGSSIATDYDGSTLVVGSPNRDNTSVTPIMSDWGLSYVYDRYIHSYEYNGTAVKGFPIDYDLTVNDIDVTIDGKVLSNSVNNDNGYYIYDTNSTIGSFNIVSITSSQSSFTVTTTVSTYIVGDYVNISGTNTLYDGTWKINNVGVNSFTVVSQLNLGTVNTGIVNVSESVLIIGDNVPLTYGDIITISSNQFIPRQVLKATQPSRIGVEFGRSVDINNSGTEILNGAPYELIDEYNNNGYIQFEGGVYRYTDVSKKYGSITGTKPALTTSIRTIFLNGFKVIIPSGYDSDQIANLIDPDVNDTPKYNNITASSDNGILTISLRKIPINPTNNKLTVVMDVDTANDLGIDVFQNTQIIVDPHRSDSTAFGYTVQFNDVGSFVVTAPKDDIYAPTTFDSEIDGVNDYDLENDTIFDNNLTTWVDIFKDSGSVYMFDYLENYNEDINNVGKFVYSQSSNDISPMLGLYYDPIYGWDTNQWDSNLWDLVVGPEIIPRNLDNSIIFTNNKLIIGQFRNNTVFNPNNVIIYENYVGTPDWGIDKEPTDIVDITKIQNIQIYDSNTNTTLDNLDYFDPLQGKLMGVVSDNLDYISNIDPANYNSDDSVNSGLMIWGNSQLGKIWFDTTNVRYVNYHQPDINYNSEYWATLFPGSDVAVYTWINSDVLPINYNGPGTVYDVDSYVIEVIETSDGVLIPTYYYWVRNTDIIFENKTLSDSIIASYISNPLGSGISYFAPYNTKAYGLYNSNDSIVDNSVLHIGFNHGNHDDSHLEVDLIKDGYRDDFLSGVPSSVYDEPTLLYNKLIDSLSGSDEVGNNVPDPWLPRKVQSGIGIRPRQSFFYFRLEALRNYIQYVNSILIQHPIIESKEPTILFEVGQYYDTTKYWDYVNWWLPDSGYSNSVKVNIQVNYYHELIALRNNSPRTIIPGMVAKVLNNNSGRSEWYVYEYDGNWTRVGLEKGTIQIKDILWNYDVTFGWDSAPWGSTGWSDFPAIETRNIIRAINEQLFVEELLIHRNRGLMLLFEYITSEALEGQNYLTWLNKTSFIDVDHTVSVLDTTPNYQSDNTEFLRGYIEEIKPYHVVIKEFTYKYTGFESVIVKTTDFDLPAQYNSSLEKWITPMARYGNTTIGDNQFTLDNNIWNNDEYINWYYNFGLKVDTIYDYPMTKLSKDFTTTDLRDNSIINVYNNSGMPQNGIINMRESYYYSYDNNSWDNVTWDEIIKIDNNEYISYNSADYENNTLVMNGRGLFNTNAGDHSVDTTVYIDLPPMIILNGGRNYTTTPSIKLNIDTTQYPQPKVEAQFKPIMVNGSIVDIEIINKGLGYVVTPTVEVEPAFSLTFSDIDVNNNIITIPILNPNNVLYTGDRVKYTVDSITTPFGNLSINQYYYVRVLTTSPFKVALYKTISDCKKDNNRIDLGSVGIGGGHTFSYSAIVIPMLSQQPVRGITTKIALDRNSYFATPLHLEILKEYRDNNKLELIVEKSWDINAWNSIIEKISNIGYGSKYPKLNSDPVRPILPFIKIATLNTINGPVNVTTVDYNWMHGPLLTPSYVYNTRFNYIDINGEIKELYIKPYMDYSYVDINGNTVINNAVVELYDDFGLQELTDLGDIGFNSIEVDFSVSPTINTYSGYVVGADYYGYIQDDILTVTSVNNGVIEINQKVLNVNIIPGTIITGFITGTGGVGTYRISTSQTLGNISIPVYFVNDGNILTVTGVTSGSVNIGSNINGIKIPNGSYILEQLSGVPNGVGTYRINNNTFTGDLKTPYSTVGITEVNNKLYLNTSPSSIGLREGFPITIVNTRNIPQIKQFDTYYISKIDDTANTITLSGTNYNFSINGSGTIVTGGDILFPSLPIVYSADKVIYGNTVWECAISNDGTVFDSNYWRPVGKNALDRIVSDYAPNDNMIGVDISQLVDGIKYPYVNYLSNRFRQNYILDTILQDPRFGMNSINDTILGDTFRSGYGPEELVPGVVLDNLEMTINDNNGVVTNPPTIYKRFRYSVDTVGYQKIYRSNLSATRQTTIAVDFVTNSDTTDTIVLTDASVLVKPYIITGTTDSTGKLELSGYVTSKITQVVLTSNFGYYVKDNTSIIISGPPNSTFTGTVYEGNMMYIDGEYIGFTKIDVNANTVSGLYRGYNNTIRHNNDIDVGGNFVTFTSGMEVQSCLDSDIMPQDYVNRYWYGPFGSYPNTTDSLFDPTNIINNPAANFLNIP